MQERRRASRQAKNRAPDHVEGAQEKIARLLGILATKDLDRTGQVTLLRGVGFGVDEIAEMLGISANNVRVASHFGRKRKSRKKRKVKKVDG